MSKQPAPDRISLTFDLYDLPTAQHRAGLAGLILQIDSMGETGNRRNPKLIPDIDEEKLTPNSATITFTRDSMQGIFDDLYAAKMVEVIVANKWPGEARPKPGEFFVSRKDPKTGEMKPAPGFAYDVVQPQAPCLSRHLPEGFKSPWHDLWRQMVWSIPRGGNNVRSRAPFIDRANERPCGDGATAWTQIVEFQGKKAHSKPISGALMLGAQAVNAEAVPFEGRVDHNLLLHFWQVVVLTFAPQVVNKKDAKVERVGYVLAVPDVADLREFRELFPEILQSLRGAEPGRTPAEARIDLPDQAGLEVLRRLKDCGKAEKDAGTGGAREQAERFEQQLTRRDRRDHVDRSGMIRELANAKAASGWNDCIRAVESYHMLKLGNNVKLLSFSRVTGRTGLVEDYENIARNYRSPLFRAALMRALIGDESWHSGMIGLFAEYPWPFFIQGEKSPKYLPRFGRDAREHLQSFHGSILEMEIDKMDDEDEIRRLSLVIQRLMNKYVDGRAAAKLQIKLEKLPKVVVNGKKRRVYPDPAKFREAQQRVCSDAFLSMRSRHDQAFVDFFADSVCSVAQFLPPADYQFVIRVLLTNPDPNPAGPKRLCWEDVKAIAMIAISACSFNVRDRDAETQGSPS